MWLSRLPLEACPTAKTRGEPEAGFQRSPATWSQHSTLNLALGSEEEGHQPHRRRQSRPWQPSLRTRPGRKQCGGTGCHQRGSLANGHAAACSLPVSKESSQPGFLFSLSDPCVSRHNYSERCSQNGLDVQLSFPNNSAGREAGNKGVGGRETGRTPSLRKG